MILQVYSIFDKKLNEFLPPMYCKDESDAIRTCSQLVNFSDSLMNRFPEDYCLHFLCEFDCKEGSFTSFCGDIDGDTVFPSGKVIVQFSDLVTDDTKKYNDILKRIETNSCVLDSKLSLFDNKLQQVDSLILRAENKVTQLESKNVDIPDFIPPKKVQPVDEKKSLLEKLFRI